MKKEINIWVVSDYPDVKPITDRQLEVVNMFLTLPESFNAVLDDAAEQWRAKVDSEVDLSLDHINRQNIRDYYSISGMQVPQLGRNKNDIFLLSGDCTWEDEHGISLVFSGTKLLQCDGVDGAWNCDDWIVE